MPAFGYSPGYDGSQHREMPRNYSLPSAGFYSHGTMMSPSPLAFSPRAVSPSSATRSPTPGSPKFSRKEPQMSTDLQGVSVKELVKALGECRFLFLFVLFYFFFLINSHLFILRKKEYENL